MKLSISYTPPQGLRQNLMMNLVKWVSPLYVFLFKQNCNVWQENRQTLLARQADSFGFALGHFLEKNEIDLMPHVESHDAYHLISGYPITVQGETELIFFILGNGKRSLFTLGSAFLAFILMPEWWGLYVKSYQRGKSFGYFVHEDFEQWLDLPMQEVYRRGSTHREY